MGDFLLVIIELFLLGGFVLSHYTRVTDGRTDGFTIAKTALHSMQRGNWILCTTFCRSQCGYIFNCFDVIGPKSGEFGRITQNNGHYAVQGH